MIEAEGWELGGLGVIGFLSIVPGESQDVLDRCMASFIWIFLANIV